MQTLGISERIKQCKAAGDAVTSMKTLCTGWNFSEVDSDVCWKECQQVLDRYNTKMSELLGMHSCLLGAADLGTEEQSAAKEAAKQNKVKFTRRLLKVLPEVIAKALGAIGSVSNITPSIYGSGIELQTAPNCEQQPSCLGIDEGIAATPTHTLVKLDILIFF